MACREVLSLLKCRVRIKPSFFKFSLKPRSPYESRTERQANWYSVSPKRIYMRVEHQLQAYILPVHNFSPATPTPRGCPKLPLARWRLQYTLQNRRGKGRHLNCLWFLSSSRQLDWAPKNLQLLDLTVLTKSLVSLSANMSSFSHSASPTLIYYILSWTFNIYWTLQWKFRLPCL